MFAFLSSFNADQKCVQENCGFGGGTFLKTYPCSYCSARGGQLSRASVYRCKDCKIKDATFPLAERFVCRHTEFLDSDMISHLKEKLNDPDSPWTGWSV